ncbi:hypothetical protein TSMEX_006878, partial [Taenia solium]
ISWDATFVAAESGPDFDEFYAAPYRFWLTLAVLRKCMCYGRANLLHPTTEGLRSTSIFGISLALVFCK